MPKRAVVDRLVRVPGIGDCGEKLGVSVNSRETASDEAGLLPTSNTVAPLHFPVVLKLIVEGSMHGLANLFGGSFGRTLHSNVAKDAMTRPTNANSNKLSMPECSNQQEARFAGVMYPWKAGQRASCAVQPQ